MSPRRPPARWVERLTADRPGTAHEIILDELRTAVMAGAARPGTLINVDDVAQRFGVSRIPVREALKTLIGEGLVDHEHGAGYVVAQLTPQELAEFYLVREVLEGAALAAAVRTAGEADDAEVHDAYATLTAVIASGDVRGHHRESRRFHLALVTPSRMHRLLGMFEAAWNITEPLQPMSYADAETTRQLHDDHLVMCEAFVARDADALVAASTAHYRRLQTVVSELPTDTGLFG